MLTRASLCLMADKELPGIGREMNYEMSLSIRALVSTQDGDIRFTFPPGWSRGTSGEGFTATSAQKKADSAVNAEPASGKHNYPIARTAIPA